MTNVLRAALLAAALTVPAVTSAGIAESWYLGRARANMKIENFGAAVEAYRKALELDPRSREASRGLGMALQRNGETDRAVAEYDRHLARFPDDHEIAFEQARLLQWSRYAYRSRDAATYLAMGLRVHDDPARRRELARLLGRDRSRLDEALAEYRRLVAVAPGDRGLRDEYLKLLLWDRRHRKEAVAELERRVAAEPANERLERELARLVAEDSRRRDEAVERYGVLAARHPEDAELRLGRARALARTGRRAEARTEYARAVALGPSAEARLEYADLLAADPSTRDDARREYEAVLRTSPRSRRARLGLARVLGARKETNDEAIAVYRTVLAEAPADAEAHRGLAHAYAWTGDTDRALAHGARADRLGPPRRDLAALEQTLRAGREPAAGGGVRILSQPGGAALTRSLAFLSGAAEPTPFTSSSVEAGLANARGAGGARASGAAVDVRGEWRPERSTRVRLGLGLDGARAAGARVAGELAFERTGDASGVALALRRTARLDSFRAYAGEHVAGELVGAASDNVAELKLFRGDDTRLTLAARGGAVTGAGMASTLVAGAGARLERTVLRRGAWTVSAALAGDATHHARDLGAGTVESGRPGLFSPPLFAAASPRLVVARDAGLAGTFALDAGPALQAVAGPGGGVRGGGDARVAFSQRLGARLRLGGEARIERIAAVHTRADAAVTASLLFP